MGIEVSSETQPGDILGDYKETVLGMIPKYWNLTKLGDHVEDLIVPMRDKPKQFRGQIPWCRIDDINGKYLCTSKNGYFVDKDTISKMNLKVFPKGTVICSCSANLGICAIAENPLITNQTFIGIVPKNTFDTEFLYYLMISYAKRLQLLSTGTTISYLPKDKFENFIVVKPPLNEQRKIAAILSAGYSILTSNRISRPSLPLLPGPAPAGRTESSGSPIVPSSRMSPSSAVEWRHDCSAPALPILRFPCDPVIVSA